MRGAITIKVGRYRLADSVIMNIKACDAGAMFTFDFPTLLKHQMVIIDEKGKFVFAEPSVPSPGVCPAGQVSKMIPSKPEVHSEGLEIRHQPTAIPLPPGRQKTGKRKPTRVRFTILFGPKCRPRSHAHALAAFMDGSSFHILYRVEAAGITYYENQLMVSEEETAIGGNVPSPCRVAKSDWPKLIDLPGDTIFNLNGDGRDWRKMNHDEMRDFIAGKTYRVTDTG